MTSSGLDDATGGHAVAFEVYGARARVAVPVPDLVPRALEQLPVHATRCEPQPGDRSFAIELDSDGDYLVVEDGRVRERASEIDGALSLLRRRLAFFAVDHARDHLVVSAGVVGYEGRAIVIPGPAMSGKSTLVAALLRAGATYYTDDWAVLDGEGRAHPFSRMLRVRGEGWLSVESLGAVHGHAPIHVGVIAQIAFNAGGCWNPRRRTAADGVMMLLGNAYGLDDPPAAMKIAHNTAAQAVVLEGERGEADEAAAALLDVAAQTRLRGSS